MSTFIAIPCMENIPTVTVKSLLELDMDKGTRISFAMNSLVYDARNSLAAQALNGDYDRIMWIDSDMTFDSDLFRRLSARLDEGYEFVTGLYFTRRLPILPVIYKDVKCIMENGKEKPTADEYDGYPRDSLFEVRGCGFGGCMMTTALVKDVADKFGYPFSPILGFGEDLSFCQRVTQSGHKIYCDSSIRLGHKSSCIVQESDYFGGKVL